MWSSSGLRHIFVSLRLLLVCDEQTLLSAYILNSVVIELQKYGYKVVVLADAVSSTSPQESNLALRRMLASGMSVNSLEGWTFELLGSAEHPLYVQPQLLGLNLCWTNPVN